MKSPSGASAETSDFAVSPVPAKVPNSGNSISSAAANLIKSLDSAFADANQNAVTAARDAEEARRNARTASELARLYQQPSSSYSQSVLSSNRVAPQSFADLPATPIHQSFDNNSSNNRTFTPYTPLTPTTTKNRIDGSPAEGMLALSLELERTKQTLAEERLLHEEERAALTKSEQKNREYEDQMEDMVNKLEAERTQHENVVQALETDLEIATRRVSAAEEDAESALELAKSNVEERERVEDWLQRSMEEIQTLRAHLSAIQQQHQQEQFLSSNSPKSSGPTNQIVSTNNDQSLEVPTGRALETIEEEDLDSDSIAPNRPARALVAAGRSILQRSLKEPVLIASPGDAAEKRRRMKERLDSVSSSSTNTSGNPPPGGPLLTPTKGQQQQQQHVGTAVEAIDICRRATKQLKESGKRLKLGGRWWSGMYNGPDELHLDAMARHYCIEVEGLLDKKNKEILELESLCSLWESGSAGPSNV